MHFDKLPFRSCASLRSALFAKKMRISLLTALAQRKTNLAFFDDDKNSHRKTHFHP